MLYSQVVYLKTAEPSLIKTLSRFANPSKIVLISKRRINGIKPFIVPELDKDSAMAYLSSLLEWYDLELDCDTTGKRIYRAVGGHPLALQLVSRQNEVLPIDTVLTNFSTVTEFSQKLYKQIFDTKLSSNAKDLLVAFMVNDGESESQMLIEMSGLPPDEFGRYAKELIDYGLVAVSGSNGHRVYRVNKLTMSYANTIGW